MIATAPRTKLHSAGSLVKPKFRNTKGVSLDLPPPPPGSHSGFSIGTSRKVTFDLTPSRREVQIYGALDLMPTRRLDPLCVLLMGRRGKGKTLGMTCLADIQRRRYEHGNMPYKIVSNYWMEPAHRVDPKLVESMNAFPDWGRNLYLCIDEVGSQLANRRSLSRVNVDFMQFITQIRKRQNELVCTTQFPQWLDMAVLYQIDLFGRMDAFNGNRAIDVSWWDWWGQFSGNDKRKAWPPQPEDVDFEITIWNADLMWDKFRSDQIIPPAWAANKDQIIMKEHGADWIEEYGLADGSWGYEVADDAAKQMNIKQPTTLPELLDQQDGPFQVNALLHLAKIFEDNIKSAKGFAVYLAANGYIVTTLDGTMMAEKGGLELEGGD